ncbi:MAG: YdcF family protein, partial [Flavobacteriales bacterium]|nr:YdcF family protein [Flavobacteriales bacterium]
LARNGVPDSLITCLDHSFSTMDEAGELKQFCDSMGYASMMVITSNYHLRRTRNTFSNVLENSNVKLNFHGAPDEAFDPDAWWTNEEALITVNNEIMKLLYYFVKY